MKLYEACEEVQEDFSALLDDELAPDEVEGVEAHLSTCSDCLRELDSLKKMQSVFQAMPRVSAPANFRVDVEETPKSAPVTLRIDPRRARAKSYKPLFVAAAMLFFIATLWGLVQTTPRETASTDATVASPADSVFNVALVESDASEATTDASGLLEAQAMSAVPESPAALDAVSKSRTAGAASAKRLMTMEESAASVDPSFAAPAEPEREFSLRRVDNRDYWTQKGYTDQEVVTLAQDSRELGDILANNPDLAKIVNIVDEVIFEFDGKWYRVAN